MNKFTIILNDGKQLDDLTMNGTMFVSAAEISEADFNAEALKAVTIIETDDTGVSSTVELKNVVCDRIFHLPEGWMFNLREPSTEEILKGQVNANTETTNIAFVVLAESGVIDEVTAGEHLSVFAPWEPNVDYVPGNLRVYPMTWTQKLYRCIQAHRSQDDWTPDKAVSLWSTASDPAIEFPDWSQPVGAHDAYQEGDKVSHNGKHWISTCNNNVWEPGVYGWTEV